MLKCFSYRHNWDEKPSQIARFMGPTWGPPGSCRHQMGPMLAPWTLLSGIVVPQPRRLYVEFLLGSEATWLQRRQTNYRPLWMRFAMARFCGTISTHFTWILSKFDEFGTVDFIFISDSIFSSWKNPTSIVGILNLWVCVLNSNHRTCVRSTDVFSLTIALVFGEQIPTFCCKPIGCFT